MKHFDFKGLKCPVPTLKLTTIVAKKEVEPGDVLEIVADCPSFESDVKQWCANSKKVLLSLKDEGGVKTAQIQF